MQNACGLFSINSSECSPLKSEGRNFFVCWSRLPQPRPVDVNSQPSPIMRLIAEALGLRCEVLGLVGRNTTLVDVDGHPFLESFDVMPWPPKTVPCNFMSFVIKPMASLRRTTVSDIIASNQRSSSSVVIHWIWSCCSCLGGTAKRFAHFEVSLKNKPLKVAESGCPNSLHTSPSTALMFVKFRFTLEIDNCRCSKASRNVRASLRAYLSIRLSPSSARK